MKYLFSWGMFILLGLVITPYQACAQEEESAEISLELYSDEFQEYFFEALKQKGIENYDKAINLLIKCKKLQPLETAIDYELGINYFALKKFDEAAVYLFKAVEYNPDNYWYLDQLFKTYETIVGTSKAMEMVENLAQKSDIHKEQLLNLYLNRGFAKEALLLLNTLGDMNGKSSKRVQQRARIEYQLSKLNKSDPNTIPASIEKSAAEGVNVVANYVKSIEEELSRKSYITMLKLVQEALELYPAEARFYVSQGMAYNGLNKPKQALESLAVALDYLVDDLELERIIYEQMSSAYTTLGDTQKATFYTQKAKKLSQ